MSYTPFEIGNRGEMVVVIWLKEKGYSIIRWDTKCPGKTDIEATGAGSGGLLVQVKACLTPDFPADLDGSEKRAIIARAKSFGFQAWSAHVVLDSYLRSVGEIAWHKLYDPPIAVAVR